MEWPIKAVPFLNFNVDKCKAMQIWKSRQIMYRGNGRELQET